MCFGCAIIFIMILFIVLFFIKFKFNKSKVKILNIQYYSSTNRIFNNMSNFYFLANYFNLANCILDSFKTGYTFSKLMEFFRYFINKYIKVYVERYFIRLTCELIYRKLNHYLLSFILNLFKCKNNLLEDKINFALDELIFYIDKGYKTY